MYQGVVISHVLLQTKQQFTQLPAVQAVGFPRENGPWNRKAECSCALPCRKLLLLQFSSLQTFQANLARRCAPMYQREMNDTNRNRFSLRSQKPFVPIAANKFIHTNALLSECRRQLSRIRSPKQETSS